MLKQVANAAAPPIQPADSVGLAGEAAYLFDRLGRLLAANCAERAGVSATSPVGPPAVSTLGDLVGAERAAGWLHELIERPSGNRLSTVLFNEQQSDAAIEVEVCRLDGADGPLLLAIVRPAADSHGGQQLGGDPLTGLADRRAIEPWIAARREAGGTVAPFALLFLDLDGFKQVNDRHGHGVGDEVLVALAERWTAAIRAGDLLARYGGDEFVLLLAGIRTRQEAGPIVERLQQTTSEPIAAAGASVRLTATMGVALSTLAGADAAQLLAAADADMYSLKRRRPK